MVDELVRCVRGIFGGDPRREPDRDKQGNVHDHKQSCENSMLSRSCYLRLHHECQEIAEKHQRASLVYVNNQQRKVRLLVSAMSCFGLLRRFRLLPLRFTAVCNDLVGEIQCLPLVLSCFDLPHQTETT